MPSLSRRLVTLGRIRHNLRYRAGIGSVELGSERLHCDAQIGNALQFRAPHPNNVIPYRKDRRPGAFLRGDTATFQYLFDRLLVSPVPQSDPITQTRCTQKQDRISREEALRHDPQSILSRIEHARHRYDACLPRLPCLVFRMMHVNLRETQLAHCALRNYPTAQVNPRSFTTHALCGRHDGQKRLRLVKAEHNAKFFYRRPQRAALHRRMKRAQPVQFHGERGLTWLRRIGPAAATHWFAWQHEARQCTRQLALPP